MDFHAPNGRRTPFDVDCIKQKCSEGVGLPGELRVRQDPILAQRVAERERVLAAAIAAKPPPPPPRSVGKAGEACFSNPLREACGVVQPLPLGLPSHQVHVSLRLHSSSRGAAEA